MGVREYSEKDLKQLAKLYKSYFKTHTLFEQTEDKVIIHLREQVKKNPCLVFEEEEEIRGALFLVSKNVDGAHKLWKLRHFAFTKSYIGEQLLKEAEDKAKENSKTAKIEMSIAESEDGINFLKAQGYEQEGCLKNHYRWQERCYILSKSFKNE